MNITGGWGRKGDDAFFPVHMHSLTENEKLLLSALKLPSKTTQQIKFEMLCYKIFPVPFAPRAHIRTKVHFLTLKNPDIFGIKYCSLGFH